MIKHLSQTFTQLKEIIFFNQTYSELKIYFTLGVISYSKARKCTRKRTFRKFLLVNYNTKRESGCERYRA